MEDDAYTQENGWGGVDLWGEDWNDVPSAIRGSFERITRMMDDRFVPRVPTLAHETTLLLRSGFMIEAWEIEREATREFSEVLWDDETGRVRPDGYLALSELRRNLEADKDLAEQQKRAEIYETILREVIEGRDVQTDAKHRPIGEIGYTFIPADEEYLKFRYHTYGGAVAKREARLNGLQEVLDWYERWGEPPPVPDTIGEAPVGSKGDEGKTLHRATWKYLILTSHILKANPDIDQFSTLAARLDEKIPHAQGESAVRNLKRITGYEKDGQGFEDFRRRVVRLAGQMENGRT